MLKAGEKAPLFALPDQNGEIVALEDFEGERVVVYFYPRDNTPGCTRQACAFAAAQDRYRELGVPVIGISRDSVGSHARFAQKHGLPFLLLSDPELEAIRAYDVWQEKMLYGKVSMGVVRTTYLIGPDGVIENVWEKARPDSNAQEILEYLADL